MSNHLCEILKIDKPIVQAAMHTLNNAKLASAVSNAGGLGLLGPNAGWNPTVDTSTGASKSMTADSRLNKKAGYEQLKKVIEETKQLTAKPFGVELFSMADRPEDDPDVFAQAKLLVNEKVPIVLMYNHITTAWTDFFHNHNMKVIYRDNTPTPENTEKAVKNKVDVIIATGFDEGGSLPVQTVGTFDVVPLVVDHAGQVPVLAAGGISDARGVKAAFALGASGVYIGTEFLTAKESPMAELLKKLVVESDAYDLVMYRAKPKFLRSIKGSLPNKLAKMDKEGKSSQEIFEAMHEYQGLIDAMLTGDLSKGWATFGNGISFIHKVQSAAEIVNDLYQGVPKEDK